jgi:hypothetical protein
MVLHDHDLQFRSEKFLSAMPPGASPRGIRPAMVPRLLSVCSSKTAVLHELGGAFGAICIVCALVSEPSSRP